MSRGLIYVYSAKGLPIIKREDSSASIWLEGYIFSISAMVKIYNARSVANVPRILILLLRYKEFATANPIYLLTIVLFRLL